MSLPLLKRTMPYEDLGRYALLINEIGDGRTRAFGTCTLNANAASTTVTDINFRGDGYILLMPTSANASAEVGNGTIYQDTTGSANGSFKLVHANNSQTDRTFAYLIFQ